MKNFVETDIESITQKALGLSSLYQIREIEKTDLLHCPPDWMKRGLQETSSGYGARLNSGYKISFNGKLHRVYVTCFSNVGSLWFKSKGRKIFLSL